MTRPKKSLQRDKAIIDQLKGDALTLVQKRITENCQTAKSERCRCIKILPNAFADAIAELAGCFKEQYAPSDLSDWLSQVYEHLLLFSVAAESESRCTVTQMSKSKKRLGNFYTPRELARFTAEKALTELVYEPDGTLKNAEQILNLKVVDASMGSGMFLSSALDFLADCLIKSRVVPDAVACRRDVLKHCLYGVDLDAAAVRVARLLLALRCGGDVSSLEIELSNKLKCGDSLVGVLPESKFHAQSIERADTLCNQFFDVPADAENRFNYFHWTFQFPEVFHGDNPGFDAVLGNPPWEILKPNSREFFQQKCSEYWTLGKQEALRIQDELRIEDQIDEEWNQYQNDFKHFSQWIGRSDTFKLQGSSDINAYKLFVELSLSIVKENGIVSLIVPSSLYSDKGSRDLREALLKRNQWKFLHTFHNAEGLFDIHRSFKFCMVLFRKGGTTSELVANFDSRNVVEAKTDSPRRLNISKLHNFSPNWLSIPEVESDQDLELVGKIASNSIRFEDVVEEFGLKYKREFDMTNDSHLFILRDQAEQSGYRADAHGRWISETDENDILLPLYEGRMVGQFDVAQKGWVRGKGRQALWLPVPDGRILPQYLIAAKNIDCTNDELKVGFLGVGSATNARSMIAACLGYYPCGNSVPTFQCRDSHIALLLTACFNSFVFDYVLRMRLVGNNLNYFILQECFLPLPDALLAEPALLEIAAKLSFNQNHLSPQLQKFLPANVQKITAPERLRLRCILDALVADLYDLSVFDLKHILRGCQTTQPGAKKSNQAEPRLSQRGFWRVDKNRPAQSRQTVLTLNAFEALKQLGRQNFLTQNDCAGWRVPAEAPEHV